MKKIAIHLMIFVSLITFLTSCKLDNYDGPNAEISGSIYDSLTNELVRQDIASGAQISFIEHGYKNPETQYMIIKNNGTFMNKQMFAGTYTMQLQLGNFVPLNEQEVVIKGKTLLNFIVQPYIRVKNAKIEKVDNTIVATFNIQTTIAGKNIKKIGLYAHLQDYVGEPSKAFYIERSIGAVVDETVEQKLVMDLDAYSTSYSVGKQYYFIVGALLDVAQAKLNYAAPVRIQL